METDFKDYLINELDESDYDQLKIKRYFSTFTHLAFEDEKDAMVNNVKEGLRFYVDYKGKPTQVEVCRVEGLFERSNGEWEFAYQIRLV